MFNLLPSSLGKTFYFCIYLFYRLAVLALRCFVQAFSRCSEQRLPFVVLCGVLIMVASLVAKHSVRASVVVALGLVALRYVGSSWTRDRTCVPSIARQILNHWTTREAP